MWDWLTGNGEKVKEALEFLTNYDSYLQFQDIFGWIGNMIGWAYIKFTYGVNTGLEKVLLNSFDMADFLKHQGLTELQSQFVSTLGFILLVISAILIGIKMIISKRPPTLKDTLVNIVIAVFLLLFSGTIINDLFDMSKQSFMDTTQIKAEAPSIQLIQDNTDDLAIVLNKGIKNIKEGDRLNKITKDNFKYVDTNEVVTPDDVEDFGESVKNKDAKYLEYRKSTDIDGKVTAVTFKESWLSKKIAPSGYRRYPANKMIIAVGETSLAIGYLFIIFSIIMCIVELAFKKIYLLVAVSTDLDTGQRRNKALESVGRSLLLIAFTGLELNIYLKLIEFIGNKTLSPFIQVVAMIVATFFLFKGSQTVSELFGVDTSIKNGAGSLMATMATLSVAKGVGKGVGKGAGFVGKKGLSAIRNKGAGKKEEEDDSNDKTKVPTRSDINNEDTNAQDTEKRKFGLFKNKNVPSDGGTSEPEETNVPKTNGQENNNNLGVTSEESHDEISPNAPNNSGNTELDPETKSASQKQELNVEKDQEQNESNENKVNVPTRDTSDLSSDGDKQKATQKKELELDSNQEVNQTGKQKSIPTRDTDTLDISNNEKMAKATEKVAKDIEREVKTNTTSRVINGDNGNSKIDLSNSSSSSNSTVIGNNSVEHATVENKTQTKVSSKLDFGEAPELTAAGKKLKEQRDAKVKNLMEGAKRNG